MAMMLGSVLPWLWTPLGTMWGTQGAGLWTLAAGSIAVAGGMWRDPRVGALHGAVGGVAALVLCAWQIARLIGLVGFSGWTPAVGLLLVVVGAGVACRPTLRVARASRG